MKFKFRSSEFTAIYEVLQCIIIMDCPKNAEGILLHAVLLRVWKKFYQKAEGTKIKVTIKLEKDEACAFHIFFSRYSFQGYSPHTTNLIIQLLTKIQKHFAL